jgi:uncharacterized membrane protein YoaK (UPF0700 family)
VTCPRAPDVQPTNTMPLSSPSVHDANACLSSAHVPSYFALAFGSGAVNAGAFLACERFVSHVTGTVTRVGLDVGAPRLMAEYALVLGAFIFGAASSVLALDLRAVRGLVPRPDWVLGAVVVVLMAIAGVGELGFFGQFGGATEESGDFALLIVLSLAMGAMNATVASSTALAIRTTHMTGPATDLGVQLGRAWLAVGDQRWKVLALAGVRGGKIISFIAGAVATTALAPRLSHLVFLIPAAVVAAATVRSFLPVTERRAPPSTRALAS